MTLNRFIHKLQTESCKVCKSAISLALALVMVLSVFVSLNITFPWLSLTASAAESQTEFSSISDYQDNEFGRIQNEIFGCNNTKNSEGIYKHNDPKTINGSYASKVQTGNDYFNWTTTSVADSDKFTKSTVSNMTTESAYIEDQTYSVYNVSTGDEFYTAMSKTSSSGNYMINITADIDMNGANQYWTPINGGSSARVYIEGNGHTIYNLRIYSTGAAGLYSNSPKYFVCRNLGFSSVMVLSNSDSANAGLLCAFIRSKILVENVHVSGGYYQVADGNSYGIGGLVGRKQEYFGVTYGSDASDDKGDCFFKNCSTADLIMYGKDHIGGMTSYVGIGANTSVAYDEDFPADAMAYVLNSSYSNSTTYPFMFEECYSVDSTIFSTGHDSGCFISCGNGIIARNCFTNNTIYATDNTGGFIGRCHDSSSAYIYDKSSNRLVNCSFISCYSTGVVEGKNAMGGFVGMLCGYRNQNFTETGLPTDNNKNYSSNSADVFLNCFTTAMVGMDYAGKYCGGFVGMDDNYYASTLTVDVDGTDKSGYGTFYVNCYAAGEVGNILTVSDIDDAATLSKSYFENDREKTADSSILDYYPTGGFTGISQLDGVDGTNDRSEITSTSTYHYGNYYNCYYDMQTTAMREIAIGNEVYYPSGSSDGTRSDSAAKFSIPGVTGVYTEESSTKSILGLTDFPSEVSKETEDSSGNTTTVTTTGQMDGSGADSKTWSYCDEYYPQLSAFMVADMTEDDVEDITSTTISSLKDLGVDITTSPFYVSDAVDSSGSSISAVTGTVSSNSTWTGTTSGSSGNYGGGGQQQQGGGSSSSTSYTGYDYYSDNTTKSAFYAYSKPVESLASVQNVTDSTTSKTVPTVLQTGTGDGQIDDPTSASQLALISEVYRYCQAATSTVLLSHWDVTMNTDTGVVSRESNDWVWGLPENRMYVVEADSKNGDDYYYLPDNTTPTKSSDYYTGEGDEAVYKYTLPDGYAAPVYVTTFDGIASGTYKLKVGQGTTSSYSHGATGVERDGDDITLDVTWDNATVKIYYSYNDEADEGYLDEYNYEIWAYITGTDQNGDIQSKVVVLHKAELKPDESTTTTYYLVGQSGLCNGVDWGKSATVNAMILLTYEEVQALDKQYLPDETDVRAEDDVIYAITVEGVKAGTYNFKITNGDWGVDHDWGLGGTTNGSNMSITIGSKCDVTVYFRLKDHKVVVKAGDLTSSSTMSSTGDASDYWFDMAAATSFEGYSVISKQKAVNGFEWLTDSEGTPVAIAKAGEMTELDDGGYSYTFKLTQSTDFGKIYAYKVIKDATDNNEDNQTFYIETPTTTAVSYDVEVTIKYYPDAGNEDDMYIVSVSGNEYGISCDEDISEKITGYYLTGDQAIIGDKFNGWQIYSVNGMEKDNTDGTYSITINYDSTRFDLEESTTNCFQKSDTAYSVKVVACQNNTLDWSTGLDWGNKNTDSGNFEFYLDEDTDNLTFTFDPNAEGDIKISVSSTTKGAVRENQYILTGDSAFTQLLGLSGEWVKEGCFDESGMEYNNSTGEYTKWIYDVSETDDSQTVDIVNATSLPILSYSFKVIPYDTTEKKGTDPQNNNITFALTPGQNQSGKYDIKITYKEKEDGKDTYESRTTVTVYNHSDTHKYATSDDVTSTVYNSSPGAAFWNIFGDKKLTGYEWRPDDDESILKAVKAGLLSPTDVTTVASALPDEEITDTGTWYKSNALRVTDIPLYGSAALSLTFKVAANGSWGESYPSDNYRITLNVPENLTATYNYCDVVIYFNNETHDIFYTAECPDATGDYSSEVDTSQFEWYIACDWELYSNNFTNTQSSPTVYDTVRDITSEFSFTSGVGTVQRGLMVSLDSERNTADRFNSSIDFDIDYSITSVFNEGEDDEISRKSDISGEFKTSILSLNVNAYEDTYKSDLINSDLIAQYYCDQFAPGKQWLKIETVGYGYSDDYIEWKEAYLNYNTYTKTYENYMQLEDLFYNYCANLSYNGGVVTKDNLIDYLIYRKENNEAAYNVLVAKVAASVAGETASGSSSTTSSTSASDIVTIYYKLQEMVTKKYNVKPSNYVDMSGQSIIGSRSIRLIPSSYLEAGVDANINVVQDASDSTGVNAANSITYTNYESDSSKQYTFTSTVTDTDKSGGTETTTYGGSSKFGFEEQSFGYYNFAVTAAYVSTDDIGLGIFKNYKGTYNGTDYDSNVINYNASQIRKDSDTTLRNSSDDSSGSTYQLDTDSTSTSVRYFAMASAYHDAASYTDSGSRTTANLNIGSLDNMSMIGATYNTGSKGDSIEDARTIIKVFNTTYNAATMEYEQGDPVFFNSDSTSHSEYADNYKKWTGQTNFTASDSGTYEVRFYWMLSDGRYLQDSKYVTISAIEPGITKTVDSEYKSVGDGELVYTVNYTNEKSTQLVNYAILDVLPFNGDSRSTTSGSTTYYSTSNITDGDSTTSNDDLSKFKLKSVKFTQTGVSDVGQVYYTTSIVPRSWTFTYDDSGSLVYDDDGVNLVTNENAASNLTLEGGKLNQATINASSWLTYASEDGTTNTAVIGSDGTVERSSNLTYNPAVTAVCLTGLHLAQGQTVTVEYTFEYTGNATERYVNNAYYKVESAGGDDPAAYGMSKPVQTTIIARNLTGYCWLDGDGDGVIDDNEYRLKNVGVRLWQLSNGSYYSVAETTTGDKGLYEFENVAGGDYKVEFYDAGGTIYAYNLTENGDEEDHTVSYEQLKGTTKYNAVKVNTSDSYGTGSYNLASSTKQLEPNSETAYGYFTDLFVMPSDSVVNSAKDVTYVSTNAIQEDYVYTRLYQNGGFKSSAADGYDYSLTVNKTDDEGTALSGVKFKLYYLNEGENKWYPIYYGTVGEGITKATVMKIDGDYVDITYETEVAEVVEANTDGKYNFTGTGSYTADTTTNTHTITFVNNGEWDTVYCYYWLPEGSSSTACASWPGNQGYNPTLNSDGYEVYTFTIPDDVSGIIFNNGNGNGKQTPDITGDNVLYTDYQLTTTTVTRNKQVWNGAVEDTVTGSGAYQADSSSTTRTVYFKNTKNWEEVACYYWSDDNTSMTTWPGDKSTNVVYEDGDGVKTYAFTIPSDAQYLIFNNNQTDDATKQQTETISDLSYTFYGYAKVLEYDSNVPPAETIYDNSYTNTEVDGKYIFTTDDSGTIDFSSLKKGTYRLVEVSNPNDGYLLYSQPIEFSLPYAISKSSATATGTADYSYSITDSTLSSEDDSYYYYNHVSLSVVNHKNQFTLPDSGASGSLWMTLIIGLLILALAAAVFAYIFLRRSKVLPAKIITEESVLDRIKRGK